MSIGGGVGGGGADSGGGGPRRPSAPVPVRAWRKVRRRLEATAGMVAPPVPVATTGGGPSTLRPVGPHCVIAPPGAEHEAALASALGRLLPVSDALILLAAAPDAAAVLRAGLPELARIAAERSAGVLVLAASGLAAALPSGRRPAEQIAERLGLPVVAPDGLVAVGLDGALQVSPAGPDPYALADWWYCAPATAPEPLGPSWPPISEGDWDEEETAVALLPPAPPGWLVDPDSAGSLWARPETTPEGTPEPVPDEQRRRLLIVGTPSQRLTEDVWDLLDPMVAELPPVEPALWGLRVDSAMDAGTTAVGRFVSRRHGLAWLPRATNTNRTAAQNWAPATVSALPEAQQEAEGAAWVPPVIEPATELAVLRGGLTAARVDAGTPLPPAVPARPAMPTVPTTPTEPVAPTVPAVPTVPTVPAVPTEPTAPTAPTAPTVPAVPTAPTAPTAPTVPAVPTVPTEPTARTVPAVPTAPTEPSAPTVPAVPTAPTVPAVPTAPSALSTPLPGYPVLAAAPAPPAVPVPPPLAAQPEREPMPIPEPVPVPEAEPELELEPILAPQRVPVLGAEPAPEPERAPEPDPEPEPEPIPAPTRIPVLGAEPARAPEQDPEPEPEPIPAPTRIPVLGADPAPELAPHPTPVPEPQPEPDPEPEPTAPAPVPASASASAPGGSVRAFPTDVAGPTAAQVSSAADRTALKALLGPQFQRWASRADQVATRLPALRSTIQDDIKADLVAVLLHHTAGGVPAPVAELTAAARSGSPGPLAAYVSCLASGLRRLPSHHGAVLLGAHVGPAVLDHYRPGTLLHEPAAVSGLTAVEARLDTPAEFAIWSTTGRRTALFGEPGEEAVVVFPPGTRFSVLEVIDAAEDAGTPVRVLLREVSPTAPAAGADNPSASADWDRNAQVRLRSWLERRDALPAEERRSVPRPERFRLTPGVDDG